jgi:hypothetical protein
VCFDVLAPMKVAVVGSDDRDVRGLRDPQHSLADHPLVRHAVLLDLEEEPILAEDLSVLVRGVGRTLLISSEDFRRDFARKAGGEPDQTL